MLITNAATRISAANRDAAAVQQLRWWSEVLLGLGFFGVYLLLNTWPLPAHEARALGNGATLLRVEQALRLDFERPVNLWLADQGWLRVAANYEYAFTYLVTTLALLVWLFRRRPEHYAWARNVFALITGMSLICFWLYPVAPPRLLPDAGFVDTVRLGQTWGSWGSPMVESANQLAAMPSLHIGWALWVSVVLVRISGRWLVQLASIGHVLLTFVVIVATANHYWLDAFGAAGVVVLSMALTRRQHMALTQETAAVREPGGAPGLDSHCD